MRDVNGTKDKNLKIAIVGAGLVSQQFNKRKNSSNGGWAWPLASENTAQLSLT